MKPDSSYRLQIVGEKMRGEVEEEEEEEERKQSKW